MTTSWKMIIHKRVILRVTITFLFVQQMGMRMTLFFVREMNCFFLHFSIIIVNSLNFSRNFRSYWNSIKYISNIVFIEFSTRWQYQRTYRYRPSNDMPARLERCFSKYIRRVGMMNFIQCALCFPSDDLTQKSLTERSKKIICREWHFSSYSHLWRCLHLQNQSETNNTTILAKQVAFLIMWRLQFISQEDLIADFSTSNCFESNRRSTLCIYCQGHGRQIFWCSNFGRKPASQLWSGGQRMEWFLLWCLLRANGYYSSHVW